MKKKIVSKQLHRQITAQMIRGEVPHSTALTVSEASPDNLHYMAVSVPTSGNIIVGNESHTYLHTYMG